MRYTSMSSSMPARLDMTKPNIYFHKVNVEIYPLFKYQPYDIALSSTIYHVVKIYKLDLIHAHYAILTHMQLTWLSKC